MHKCLLTFENTLLGCEYPGEWLWGRLGAHKGDLGSHLYEAEVLIVEADAYLAAFRT